MQPKIGVSSSKIPFLNDDYKSKWSIKNPQEVYNNYQALCLVEKLRKSTVTHKNIDSCTKTINRIKERLSNFINVLRALYHNFNNSAKYSRPKNPQSSGTIDMNFAA